MLGIYLTLHRDPIDFFRHMVRQYGDVVYMRVGSRHDFLVNNPEYIKEILFTPERIDRATPKALKCLLGNSLMTSQGEEHREQRRTVQPAFHAQKINSFGKTMAERADEFSNGWQDGATVDIAQEMKHLALRIAARTLLSYEFREKEHELIHALDTFRSVTSQKAVPFIDRLLWHLPLRCNQKFKEARATIHRIIEDLVASHRPGEPGASDLISFLFEAQSKEQDSQVSASQAVRDQILTLIFGGHETTAAALTWSYYLLSQNPETEKKLQDELKNVLGGRLPSVEDFPKLPYTRGVFLESMRLYPPVWLFGRRPLTDIKVGHYAIYAGSYVHLSPYLMHRDERYFPEPDRFDPERWRPEVASKRPRFSYFPFGGGPRQCIGEGFAMTEGTIVLATVLQKWRLLFAGKNHPDMEPLITLWPKNGMPMKFEKRNP